MSAPSFDEVYNFEGAILNPLAMLIAAQGIAIYTPSNDALRTDAWIAANPTLVDLVLPSNVDFQELRPRVEMVYQHGSETGHVYPPVCRPDVWTASLMVGIVTAPIAAAHEQFRARVRNVMAICRTTLYNDRTTGTDALLPYHCILDIVDSGTSPATQPEDGHYLSSLTYQLKVNIRPTAWPAEA